MVWRVRVRCGRVWMRVRGLPVREGVREVRVRRAGRAARVPRDCVACEGALWARVRGVPVREGYGRMGGGWIWKRSRFWCW